MVVTVLAGLTLLPGRVASASPARGHVIGGTDATPGAFPFIALLLTRVTGGYAAYCDGTLVAPHWVLTAAHCVTGDQGPTALVFPDAVLIGRQNLAASNGDVNEAARIYVDPRWSPTAVGDPYDEALLYLSHASPEPPVALATASQSAQIRPGLEGLVLGFGATDAISQTFPTALQMAPVPVQPDSLCTRFYGSQFVPGLELCGGALGVGACPGDSGGPLLFQTVDGAFVEGGIVHKGPDPCGLGPNMYASIDSARSFIDSTMRSAPASQAGASGRLRGSPAPAG